MGAVGGNRDGEWALGAFGQSWAGGFLLVLGGVGVSDLHLAGPEDLESVVEVPSGSDALGTEACAWILDLNDGEWSSGAVRDGGVDVGRVAAGHEDKKAQEGHPSHCFEREERKSRVLCRAENCGVIQLSFRGVDRHSN